MADIKWIKLTANMHEDEKMKLMDAMPGRDTNHYLWIRLLIQAGKTNSNGYIYLSENIPYTDEMLATIFNRPIESVKLALKILSDFEMIEVAPNNIIKIINWDKHQNIEGMERVRAQNRKRAENHREKKKQIKQVVKKNSEENFDNTNDKEKKENFENIKGQEEKAKKMDNIIEENSITDELDTSEVCSKDNNSTSNVTVTEQNKKEIKNKKKIKRESNNTGDIKNKSSTYEKESEGLTLSQDDNSKNNSKAIADNSINFEDENKTMETQSVNLKAIEILMHYEKLTGIPGIFNPGSIALAIDMHGEKQVKMAINKALELNKTDMPYINGILKNWRREGYPSEREEKKNGVRSTGQNNCSDKNEFTGFKPKKPRNLTQAERKGAERKAYIGVTNAKIQVGF